MNNRELVNYIKVYDQVIPADLCDYIITESSFLDWRTHSWQSKTENGQVQHITANTSTELSVLDTFPSKIRLILVSWLTKCIKDYNQTFQVSTNSFSPIRLNKYDLGTNMKHHFDHIYSLFDGKNKGIPVLSIVGLLNEEFEGGQFIFWDNHEINLKKGSILIFPSVFLYSHRVDTVLKGTRYSFVSWAY